MIKSSNGTVEQTLAEALEHFRAGRHGECERLCREVPSGDTVQNAEVLHLLGAALDAQGRYAEALEPLQRALGLAPERADFLVTLGNVCGHLGADEDAVTLYGQALVLEADSPETAGTVRNLGQALRRLEEYEDSAACLREALQRHPGDAGLHAALAATLGEMEEFDEAHEHYGRALKLDPGNGEAHGNLGNLLRDLGRIDEALDHYARAVTLLGSDSIGATGAKVNRALALILAGRYGEGWDAYERRLDQPDFLPPGDLPPRWDGEPLEGKSILVHDEQGIGDVIMFATCLPDLVATGARVVLICEKRLETLFARSFPSARVIPHHGQRFEGVKPGDADFSLPIGSLPRHFRRDEADFPQQNRILQPDPAKTATWRGRFAELGPGLKIGMSWRGGVKPWDKRRRTTRLEEWLPLFRVPGTRFISFQHGDTAEEREALKTEHGVVVEDFTEGDDSFDDFAARIDALDLVISMANTTVHVASALGKPVWSLIPRVPGWRWGFHGSTSPWYPSMTMLRQEGGQGWTAALEDAAAMLADFAAGDGASS
ncbi:MAG: tetratricopeptide repeat protein [Alphaproteobacteria bacterium]|nr:tetratricopeptide repeat protein [Alphaproteobacteria bacterium]